ncbi:hypothetical protein [Phaeobacter inhibens]|uniref:hypothetical protein n=1 Tax=Phaeobacter inhibens TaxID=221822 RepID=UPI00131477BE|nr:hypothetical protein [Phaeobacter inhibens]
MAKLKPPVGRKAGVPNPISAEGVFACFFGKLDFAESPKMLRHRYLGSRQNKPVADE